MVLSRATSGWSQRQFEYVMIVVNKGKCQRCIIFPGYIIWLYDDSFNIIAKKI